MHILKENAYRGRIFLRRIFLDKIPIKSFTKSEGSKFGYIPTFLFSNVMLLAPKIDEVREVVQQRNYDLVCLVETWLQDHIHDNVVRMYQGIT